MKFFPRVNFLVPLVVFGAAWSQTAMAASPPEVTVDVGGTYNGVGAGAGTVFTSLDTPQSFDSTGVHFTASGYPLPVMSLEVSNENGTVGTASSLRATSLFSYFFEISGPTSSSVPLIFSGAYGAAVSNGNWGTNTIVGYRIANDAARGTFQCSRDLTSGCGQGTFGGTLAVAANHEYPVYLSLEVQAIANNIYSTSAAASIDPYFYIDPTWAAVNPGYSLTVSGVGNSVPAIPEPETYAMMLAGLGLLGIAARRRKQKQVAK